MATVPQRHGRTDGRHTVALPCIAHSTSRGKLTNDSDTYTTEWRMYLYSDTCQWLLRLPCRLVLQPVRQHAALRRGWFISSLSVSKAAVSMLSMCQTALSNGQKARLSKRLPSVCWQFDIADWRQECGRAFTWALIVRMVASGRVF